MPLDPLSALSVAAAVVQFIDFARTIVCRSKEIYRVTNGILPEESDAKSAAERLADLAQELETPVLFTDFAKEALAAMPDTIRDEMRVRYQRMNGRLGSIRKECYTLHRSCPKSYHSWKSPHELSFGGGKAFVVH